MWTPSRRMKRLYEEELSPSRQQQHISNEASTSRQECSCKQQEQVLDEKEEDDNVLHKGSFILDWLPEGVDLKPIQMVLAEVVGTFIVVLGICGTSSSGHGQEGLLVLLQYAVAAGASVVVAVYSTGPICGAHINPANTFAFALFGHFPWSKVPFYMMGQVGGSSLATYVGTVVYGLKPEVMVTVPYGGWKAAFWAEILATFVVTFLAASIAKNHKSVGELMGIVMGIAVMMVVLITGPISGGSLNPARSLGPAIVAWNFKHIWVYLLAPTIGSVLGVFMLHLLSLQTSPSPNN